MNIILCGMPGSGKSYFGAKAAQKLNWPFIDTDQLIISAYLTSHHEQATCREICLKKGEVFFRHLESQILKSLKITRQSIIATGGGILCTKKNIPLLKNLGQMIYLKVPSDILLKRLMNKYPLPSYIDQNDIEGSFNSLLQKRLPLYEQHCSYSIDVSSHEVY